jgi:hypothetical protein
MFYQTITLLLVCSLILSACTTVKKSLDKQDSKSPKLLAPAVRKIWITESVKEGGQEWEEGHYLYKIERGTSWSR